MSSSISLEEMQAAPICGNRRWLAEAIDLDPAALTETVIRLRSGYGGGGSGGAAERPSTGAASHVQKPLRSPQGAVVGQAVAERAARQPTVHAASEGGRDLGAAWPAEVTKGSPKEGSLLAGRRQPKERVATRGQPSRQKGRGGLAARDADGFDDLDDLEDLDGFDDFDGFDG